jgi:type 2 lantibiotic biosynthesis protein LanM
MRLVRKRLPIPGRDNRPSLPNCEIDLRDYTEDIVAGFTHAYRLIVENREELLAPEGPIAAFGDDEIRAVLRATRTYALILNESFHPDVLRDALDRDRLFDKLWLEVRTRPCLSSVIAAELADLQLGDIPAFSSRPSSRDLWTSTGDPIPDFFDESSLNLVRRRLQQLDEDDLSRQVWFIRASMATLAVGQGHNGWAGYRAIEPETAADRDRLLRGAREIGDRLSVLAIRSEDVASWMGLTLLNERTWALLPLSGDLYGGTLGVALFLAYLGEITAQERYTALARAALVPVNRQVQKVLSQPPASPGPTQVPTGVFSGCAGLIYVLTHLGSLWRESELLAIAEALVQHLPPVIEHDDHLDLISGSAGCIGALLSLYHTTSSKHALATSAQCGDHLVQRSRLMSEGIGWDSILEATQPLCGFSHGAAGMAWALLEVGRATGEPRFTKAGLDAITYERSVFSSKARNWPDFRIIDKEAPKQPGSNNPSFMVAWCHGAPGIGLARLASLEQIDTRETRAEIEAALLTTVELGLGLNHSLCHGDLGNVELLLQASMKLQEPKWQAHLSRASAIILESIDRHGWLCGVPLAVETPGLMTGLAGIGYGLLRLAEPQRVPSILSVEPPRQNP